MAAHSTEPLDAHEAQLRDVAAMIRRIYLRVLQDSIGRSETEGACFYACILLQQAVERFTPMSSKIRGGDGIEDGGYFDPLGRGFGHYWVEARLDESLAWVLDITADQFGAQDVIVMPLPASLAVYKPGDQRKVDEHVEEHGITMENQA